MQSYQFSQYGVCWQHAYCISSTRPYSYTQPTLINRLDRTHTHITQECRSNIGLQLKCCTDSHDSRIFEWEAIQFHVNGICCTAVEQTARCNAQQANFESLHKRLLFERNLACILSLFLFYKVVQYDNRTMIVFAWNEIRLPIFWVHRLIWARGSQLYSTNETHKSCVVWCET